ncbi:hypothetical protein GS493_20555 [Rhodococcus hoagii]|nr:hypothetical protein [Prescottella equi]
MDVAAACIAAACVATAPGARRRTVAPNPFPAPEPADASASPGGLVGAVVVLGAVVVEDGAVVVVSAVVSPSSLHPASNSADAMTPAPRTAALIRRITQFLPIDRYMPDKQIPVGW